MQILLDPLMSVVHLLKFTVIIVRILFVREALTAVSVVCTENSKEPRLRLYKIWPLSQATGFWEADCPAVLPAVFPLSLIGLMRHSFLQEQSAHHQASSHSSMISCLAFAQLIINLLPDADFPMHRIEDADLAELLITR